MQSSVLKITGLQTNPNYLSNAPGSLSLANNVVLDRPSVMSSRRGIHKYSSYNASMETNAIRALINFSGNLLAWYDNKIAWCNGGVMYGYTAGATPPVAKIGIRHILSGGSLFVTTDKGVLKLEGVTKEFAEAGMPRGLGIEASLTMETGGGQMSNNVQLAYRVVFGITDANSVLVLGAPSDRAELANESGSSSDVKLKIYIPSGITTSHFFQVYRSGESADANSVASDELYLVYEDHPTAADITNGYVTITDSTPSSLLGATLYTSPSQEGIGQANGQPPLAVDMTIYKGHALYARTKTVHRLYISLIAAGGAFGVQVDDTISIGSTTYTCKATEDATSAEYKLYTTGTAAENIRDTAQSLVRVINQYSGNTVYSAYYVSNWDDLPGKILIERDDFTDTAVSVTVNTRGQAWNPVLPTTGTSISTTNENKPNRIYISKPGQAEAVPLTNYIDAGTEDSAILRIIGLRDSCFVLKDNGEVYRIIGDSINDMTITLFDNTIKLRGPKTAVVFNNSIYAFTNQGIISLADTGAQVLSFNNIEDQLLPYMSDELYPNFELTSFAVGYESDRKYILFDGATAYVWNSFTRTFTTWTMEAYGGVVMNDDKLYIGNDDGYIYVERKDRTKWDFADQEYLVTIVRHVSDYVVEIEYNVNVIAGMTLKQGSRSSYIESVSLNAETMSLTLEKYKSWDTGTGSTAAYVYTPILCTVKFNPLFGDNPATLKRFSEIQFDFLSMNDDFTCVFRNNFDLVNDEEVEIVPEFVGQGFGSLPWGSGPWGGAESSAQEARTYFPTALSRAAWAIVQVKTQKSFTDFTFLGISLFYRPMSQKFTRTIT